MARSNIMVFGVDPSSRKLAIVYSYLGDEKNAQYKTKKLPQSKPESCSMAHEWIKGIIESLPIETEKVYVFVELPVMGRGGIGSTLPQAQVNGAFLAGAFMAGATVVPVNNMTVKKQVVGKGNASKDDVKEWLRNSWLRHFQKVGNDQDLCDASMIYVYGVKKVKLRVRIEGKTRPKIVKKTRSK